MYPDRSIIVLSLLIVSLYVAVQGVTQSIAPPESLPSSQLLAAKTQVGGNPSPPRGRRRRSFLQYQSNSAPTLSLIMKLS